ncbi:MAG: IS66 family insertion sequence element accessory protein TnpB, partial [Planctomycetota bacterium]
MYVVASGLKIYACLEPTDMRRSFDGLMGMVQQLLAEDPLSGHLFLFRNRGRDR